MSVTSLWVRERQESSGYEDATVSFLDVVSIHNYEASSDTRSKSKTSSNTWFQHRNGSVERFSRKLCSPVGGKLHQRALGGVFCSRVFVFKTCYCLAHGNCFLCSVFLKSPNRLLLFWWGASTSTHQSLFPGWKSKCGFLKCKELAGTPNFRGRPWIVSLLLGHTNLRTIPEYRMHRCELIAWE